MRELTRVVTPATEAAWVAAARGKNLRQIEDLVADHSPGDDPDDLPDPQVRTRVVRFELSPESFVLLRQARTALDDENGGNLTDDAFVTALCGAVLDGVSQTEPNGRARFQIALTVCEHCRQGWQEGGGVKVAVDAAAVERAECDAQHVGSIDGDVPDRAYQDIPPGVARFVWRRDGGRCRLPGCRSARALELHHLVHRAEGGSHEASNIVLCCGAHHASHHRGVLTITGTADRLEVRWPEAMPQGSAVEALDLNASQAAAVVAPKSGTMDVSHAGETRTGDIPRAAKTCTGDIPRAAESGIDGVPCTGKTRGGDVARIAETRAQDASRVATFSNTGAPRAPALPDETGALGVGGPSKLELVTRCTQAKAALTGLGWMPAIARKAVADASAALGPEATLERLIFEALRRCRQPPL